jgi:hypothetical protein
LNDSDCFGADLLIVEEYARYTLEKVVFEGNNLKAILRANAFFSCCGNFGYYYPLFWSVRSDRWILLPYKANCSKSAAWQV